jgi:ZIP family zinc transporter
MATLYFFCGAGITHLLDRIVHRIGAWQKKKSGKARAVCACNTEPADMLRERAMFSDAPGALELQQPGPLEHPIMNDIEHPVMKDMIDDPEKENLKNMGVMTAVAIGIHNFPEGLATFVAALADTKLGIALALAIAVHNIPEGICVAMPVYYATGSKWKGFWWSFVSGLSEPFGGLCGYLVLYGGNMTDTAYGALFGIVGGMMIYISLKELLPTAHKYDPHDHYVTDSMFAGMAVMALSLILFTL